MVEFSRRAHIQFDTLRSTNQQEVDRVLRALAASPQDFDPALNVRKLAMPDSTYLVKAGPSLRVLFTNANAAIQVLDIVPQERLDAFHEGLVAAGEQ